MDKRYSIIPLFFLSVAYWLRDRFLYNRVPKRITDVTLTQWRTLILFTPVWVFLQWVLSEQILSGELAFAMVTVSGVTIVQHYYVLGVLNDSFYQTPQQVKALIFGIFIQFLWTVVRVIVYARDKEPGCQP